MLFIALLGIIALTCCKKRSCCATIYMVVLIIAIIPFIVLIVYVADDAILRGQLLPMLDACVHRLFDELATGEQTID